jgi:hypothetical protein
MVGYTEITHSGQRIESRRSSYQVEMKPFCAFLMAATLSCAVNTSRAQLQLVPEHPVQRVFGGMAQKVNVVWYNAGENTVKAEVHARLYQATSATVAPSGEIPWKRLEVLPRQTILESVSLDFPAVRAETRFLVQWIVGTNQPTEPTEILVYPTNLLNELNGLVHGDDFGVLDPGDHIKPLLTQSGIDFLDLGTVPLEKFHGKLAIIGPYDTKAQMREGLGMAVKKIAAAGVAVVWLQPPSDPAEEIKPSFYVVSGNKATVVVVQPELVASVSKNPLSQLNLVYFCKLSLNPTPFSLPNLASQP